MKLRTSLLLSFILLYSVVLPTTAIVAQAIQSGHSNSFSNFGRIQTHEYLSALDASRLQIAKIYPGASSTLAFIEGKMGTLDAKRQILEYAVNRMQADAIMIGWRRQPSKFDSRDQLESPLNSGRLNPSYIKHLDEWVALAKEYNIYVIFEEWFDPMLAKARGEWTGFDDWTFHEHWANFYRVLATHFSGNTYIAGFIPGEDVVFVQEPYPYPSSGSPQFNDLWNKVMTKLSRALHEGDSNFNFIAIPTLDWSGGIYTLGSEAIYPNAWQPLNDTNPHVLYRVMWNPKNSIKTSSLYPFDDYAWTGDQRGSGLLHGAINWHKETGLPITIECIVEYRKEVGGVWIWDTAGFQWLTDFLTAMKNEGIGLNVGAFASGSEPYTTHDEFGNERSWVSFLS